MKRIVAWTASAMLALVGLAMPAFAGASVAQVAEGTDVPRMLSADAGDVSIPVARPAAVTGATAPANEATRERIYVKDFYDRDYSRLYATGATPDDGPVIEAALNAAAGKTLVFEKDKTYTFGSYVHDSGGTLWRSQGIHLKVSDVVIEGNGATIRWDDAQGFIPGDGFALEGTKDKPIENIVIRDLNFYACNNSRTWTDAATGKTFEHANLVQLKGYCCENVLVENCSFTAVPNPDPTLKAQSDREGRGISNIWFYGGAKNITVRGCTMCDVTCGSQESGSNLLFSGDCEWLNNSSAEFRSAYAAMTPEMQYRTICEQHLQGSIENILVEDNSFEHACHDECISLWCAEVFKDVLIQDNRFDIHDGDAHVPSTVNFTFGQTASINRDRLDNVSFTGNDVYAEATQCLMSSASDRGGDLHVTHNELHVKRIKRDRQRDPSTYVYSERPDAASSNGIIYAGYNGDYVDVSNNRITYDNDGGLGYLNLMGTTKLLCESNTFVANGPLSFLTVLYASEAAGAAGSESVFVNNSFDINGTLTKALVRGSSRFEGNVVRLNGTVTADALFSLAGNIDRSKATPVNVPYVLADDLSIRNNKVFANTALPKGVSALSVYDASCVGHAISFAGNRLWSTVTQDAGTRALVRVQDVQGVSPTVDATGTKSNLFDRLIFYRTGAGDDGYGDYGAALVDPTVRYDGTDYTATGEHGTTHTLGTTAYDGADDVSLAFADANLHSALVTQLKGQGIAYEADEDAKTVDLTPAEAAKVTELDLGFESVSDLTGIEGLAKLPNLTRLDLSHNTLSGSAGAPLAALTNLTYLDLYQNSIDDWSFLGSLTRLEHLNLAFNKRGGDTREALRKLRRLRWLDFSWVGPVSEEKTGANPTGTYNYVIGIVSELTNLEYLDLSNWHVNSLEGVGSLTRLKTLVANYNYVNDLSPLATCAALEELHVAFNRLDWGNNPGVTSIFTADGALIMPSLKKLDLWGQESRTDSINRLFDTASDGHRSINKLYQLHKEKKLALGYDYRWIDELVAMKPRVDSRGISYIAYDDFGTFCREGYDDWNAMRNAHAYANEHGCEVRSTAGEGSTAAQGKTYHIYGLYYNYYHQVQCPVYTSVDWQGATIYVHDEDLDWHDRANEPLFTMRPSPVGFTGADRRLADNTRTLEANPATGDPTLTINAGKLPLVRATTSIKGLSDEIDGAIAELNKLGYVRYYVQLFDANTLRYGRGYNYDRPGSPQWDALIVDADGRVVRQNAAKLAFDKARDYVPEDPEPLQWQFDHLTKVVIAPIAKTRAHIRNARFVTMPFSSRRQLPKSRWSSDYTRDLEITGTNLEVAGITQTVGTAEGGYDNGNYSGLYVGFINLKDCAELSVHDCYTWQRVCTRSTYGINTTRICQAHINNVGDSNPVYRAGHGNHGGNYAKHMLWEHITLGRIDQHTGCYDMCVRDSDVHSLSLTGAGPLTVERTTVTSGSFFNFRADYGSTWDGVAHVIDCTHYPILGSTGEPDCFAACTPDMKKQDFGHPRRFPELHVKDFTIDCGTYHRSTGTRYRITYGIIANHVNGLNLLDNYWPDTVEIDGLDVCNWRDTIGYELHTLLPLYMQGKPARQCRVGAWTLRNVTYDGMPLESVSNADLETGEDLVEVGELVAGISGVRDSKLFTKVLTPEQGALLEEGLVDGDIVVAYTGDEPRVLLRASGSGFADSDASWTSAYPYLVEHRGDVEVAYYSGREFLARRSRLTATTVGAFTTIGVYPERIAGSNGEAGQDGVTNVLHVQLAKTRRDHEHDWGEPSYTWGDDAVTCTATHSCSICEKQESETVDAAATVTQPATCAQKGVTTLTAKFSNAAFATQAKTVETAMDAAAHDWDAWVVTKVPTETDEGEEARSCRNEASHIESRSLPKRGSALKDDASFDGGGVRTDVEGVSVSAESLGIGGGGALFAPAISPHDANTFITGADMGGVYVSHDAGKSWKRHELCGQTMYAVAFDAGRKGCVYAGSSGLARSRDNGDTWELLWPKAASVVDDPNTYELLRHNYHNTGSWPATGTVRAIAVDPAESTHLYVLVMGYPKELDWQRGWTLYQSLDDGETFTSLGAVAYDQRGIDDVYEDVRVFVLGGVPYVFTHTGIYRPKDASVNLEAVYTPDGSTYHSVVSADLMDDGRVALAEALEAPPASGTYRPKTSLRLFSRKDDGAFAVDEDLTEALQTETSDFSLMCSRYPENVEKRFAVSVSQVRSSGNRLYFVNVSSLEGTSSLVFLTGLCDLGQPSGSRMRWVYGFPQWHDFWKNDSRHFDEYDIVLRGHSDTFYQHFGVAPDPTDPKALLLCVGGGILHTTDCDFSRPADGAWPSNRSNFRQLYTTNPEEGEFVTTGIDEQTTYGLRQDPFDKDHLALLYTDLGLWASNNGGASWHKCDNDSDAGGKLSSNVYDLVFDSYVKDRAYAAWSAQHDAPYDKSSANGGRGGVAISADGGTTWEEGENGLPERLVPMRLAVVYPTDAAARATGTGRTIWLATFGAGFWRSTDSGHTFSEVNSGVTKTTDGLILGADIVASDDGSHVFALTTPGTSGRGTTTGPDHHGRVYEWDASKNAWRELAWPDGSDVECPKTLFWDEASSILYVSCVAAYDKMATADQYYNFGGGLFTYRPGDATLAAVDAASNVVGATCSVEGATTDSAGNLFVSDLRGSVYLRRVGESAFVKLYDGFHLVSKDVQLVGETTGDDGTQHDLLALPSFGGGLLQLSVSVTPDQAAHEHSWGEPTYTWSDNYATCTATRVCKDDASHVETETVTTSARVAREATATRPGTMTYAARFVNPAFAAQTKDAEIPALGGWGPWGVVTPATCLAAGLERRASLLDASEVEERVVPALGHAWNGGIVTRVATCESAGRRVLVCLRDISHTTVEEVPALGHSWGPWEQVTPATCDATGLERRTCVRDASHVEERGVAALGHRAVAVEALAAACSSSGRRAHWRCERCGGLYLDEACATPVDAAALTLPPLDHQARFVAALPAGCEQEGRRAHWRCERCGELFLDAGCTRTANAAGLAIPALGHDWDEGVVTLEPTYSSPGKRVRTCRHDASHVREEEMPVLDPVLNAPVLELRAHVEAAGWMSPVRGSSLVVGTTGLGLRLEALKASLVPSSAGAVECRAHVQGMGWQDWASGFCGTAGRGLRIEAVQMRLAGEISTTHALWCRAHVEGLGWLGWAPSGMPAGTVGRGLRLEALELSVLPLGTRPAGADGAVSAFAGSLVSASAHVQGRGWMPAVSAGAVCGTTGHALRLEALGLALFGQPFAGEVEYRAHVQGLGWQEWTSDGRVAGTVGLGRRLEAVECRLTGEMAEHYELWCQAHVQGVGWMAWVGSGAVCGTTGRSLRLEAVRFAVLPKGSPAPVT